MRALHVAFFLTGLVTVLLGPLVPIAGGAWGLDDAGAGTLFAAQFLASVAAGTASTAIAARAGASRVLAAGLLAIAAGLVLLATTRWPAIAIAAALIGVGTGLIVPESNLIVARARPHDASGALSLLNLMWSGGALTWPVLVAAATPRWAPATLMGAVAAAAVGVAAVMLAGHGPPPAAPARPSRAQPASDATGAGQVGRLSPVVALGLAFFLYGAAETAFGGWIAAYISRLGATAATTWAAGPAAFYGALAGGRLVMPWVLRRVPEAVVLVAGLALGAAAIAAALASAGIAVVVAASAAAGLGFSGVFPITAAAVARDLGDRAPTLGGPLITLGGLGAAAGPWAVGLVAARTRSLRAGLVLSLASTLALLVVQGWRLRRRGR